MSKKDNRIADLELAMVLLLEASSPYLKRKKMTKRSDCKFLNDIHFVAKQVLKRGKDD